MDIMKSIKTAFWVVILGLAALWAMSSFPWPDSLSFIAVRNMLVQFSGILSIGPMSVAMILATRLGWVDRWLNGLDKSYRLHKWLGISALVTSVVHWMSAKGPGWLMGLGLIERPSRGAPPEAGSTLEAFLTSQRGLAESIGEWAFYAAIALILVALTRRIPYRYFVSVHTLLAVAYLALVAHAIVLLDFSAWTQPVGIVVAVLMAGGVFSAVLALTGRIGRRRKVGGRVARISNIPAMKITEIEIELEEGWKGHEAGQFAFITFHRSEGHHPFTLASTWNPQTRRVTFITKALGDYTERLPEALKEGTPVTVEGPYGRFTFDDTRPRQIWIGGGIGITPFIARMKQLGQSPDGRSIDLFHSVRDIAPEARELLDADVAASGVNLHLMLDGRDAPLTGERLRAMLPDWASASVWFCGPAAFGDALRRDLVAHGLPAGAFHRELFDMR